MSVVSRRIWQPLKNKLQPIVRDYTDVLMEMGKDIRSHPFSSLSKLSVIGAFFWSANVAPDMQSYEDQVTIANADIGEVSESERRKSSFDHVARRAELLSQDRLDFMWLGPISLVVEREYPRSLKLFRATHSTAWFDSLLSFPRHIADVGFNKNWFMLQLAMVDYDISEELSPPSSPAEVIFNRIFKRE
eukprot:gene10250-2406_t